jgi:hypothetical protein
VDVPFRQFRVEQPVAAKKRAIRTADMVGTIGEELKATRQPEHETQVLDPHVLCKKAQEVGRHPAGLRANRFMHLTPVNQFRAIFTGKGEQIRRGGKPLLQRRIHRLPSPGTGALTRPARLLSWRL